MMFVSAFWFGVISTLAAEFLIATAHVLITDVREQREEKEEDDEDER